MHFYCKIEPNMSKLCFYRRIFLLKGLINNTVISDPNPNPTGQIITDPDPNR